MLSGISFKFKRLLGVTNFMCEKVVLQRTITGDFSGTTESDSAGTNEVAISGATELASTGNTGGAFSGATELASTGNTECAFFGATELASTGKARVFMFDFCIVVVVFLLFCPKTHCLSQNIAIPFTK